MRSITDTKTLAYLESHVNQISEEIETSGVPVIITRDGKASMVIEGIRQFREKEELIAALKMIALGEKDRLEEKGLTISQSRTQLLTARQHRK